MHKRNCPVACTEDVEDSCLPAGLWILLLTKKKIGVYVNACFVFILWSNVIQLLLITIMCGVRSDAGTIGH